MNAEKRKKLEAAGYKVYDDAADWLGMTAEEKKLLDVRAAAREAVRAARERAGLTQKQLADKLGTSQPAVARIESGAAETSLDMMVKALFAAGGAMRDLITAPGRKRPARSTPKRGSAYRSAGSAIIGKAIEAKGRRSATSV